MIEIASDGLLREVARLYVQLQRQGVACCRGTTLSQCLVLTEVGRNAPLTLAALGKRLGLGKSWTSRAVERLVKQGLLTKVPGQMDRRQVMVTLSPAGQEHYQDLNRFLNDQSAAVMRRIPASERAGVYRSLEVLLLALRREIEEASN
jgi:DNA-binding MarR family transcriptional regulator